MPAQSGKPRFVVRAVGSETIVYDTRTHKAHCLGPEAAAVWRECDGQRSVFDIAGRARLAGGDPIDDTSVTVALRRLERAGLIEGQVSRTAGGLEGSSEHVAGRRAALRRVAALAGLTVLSLAVPTPEAAAATCTRQVFQTCQRSADCCPTNQGGPACCVNTGIFGNRCLPTGVGTCLP
jgi:hypothetical protein